MNKDCVSLGMAKQLKEAGWSADASYSYVKHKCCAEHRAGEGPFECSQAYDSSPSFTPCEKWRDNEPELTPANCSCWYDGDCIHDWDEEIKAPTIGELLVTLKKGRPGISLYDCGQGYWRAIVVDGGGKTEFMANRKDTPADACADLWIELNKKP